MQDYWLHIVASQSPDAAVPSTYTLTRATAPIRNLQGSAMPTVHHPTWEQLAGRLRGVGVLDAELAKAKKQLDNTRECTIQGVHLSDVQLRALGFTDVPAEAPEETTTRRNHSRPARTLPVNRQ